MTRAELRRAALPAASCALLFAAVIVGRNARDALFLQDVGLRWLPPMYVVNAAFVGVGAWLVGRSIDRVDRRRFLAVLLAVLAAASAVSWPLATRHAVWATLVCYVVVQLYWVLGQLVFWTFASELYDPREQKRMIPLVAAGGLVGQVVAGFGGKPLLRVVTPEQLFVVAGGLLAGAALVVTLTPRRARDALAAASGGGEAGRAAPSAAGAAPGPGPMEVLRHPLVGGLAQLTVLLWVVFTVLDFQFSAAARARYPDQAELTGFLGLFRGVAGAAALGLQLFVTPRLVAALGVGRAIALHPGFVTAAAAAMGAKFGFWTASAGKLGDHVLLYTVQDGAYQMLWNAVPASRRGRARTLVEGTIKPAAMALAGVLLVVAARLLTPAQLSWVLFAAAAAWLFVALRLRRAYVNALLEAVGAAVSEGGAATATELREALGGPDAARTFSGIVAGDDPRRASAAAELAGAMGASAARPALVAALGAAAPELRAAAAGALARVGSKDDAPALVALAERDPAVEVRQRALEAVAVLGDDAYGERLAALLHDPEPAVVSSAIAALIRIGGLEGVLASAETLGAMLRSPDARQRREAAFILGEVRVRHFTPTLVRLTRDDDHGVRVRAVKSLGRIADPRAVDALTPLLVMPELGRVAVGALVRIGAPARVALERALAGSPDAEARRRAASALGRLGAPEALAALGRATADRDPAVRDAVLVALSRLVPRGVAREQAELRAALLTLARAELDAAWRWRATAETLAAGAVRAEPTAAYLLDVVAEAEHDGVDRALAAAGLLSDPQAMHGLRARLARGRAHERMLALEAIENLIERELVARLSPLVERWGSDAAIGAPATGVAALAAAPAGGSASGPPTASPAPPAGPAGSAAAVPMCASVVGLCATHPSEAVRIAFAIAVRGQPDSPLAAAARAAGVQPEAPMISHLDKLLVLRLAPLFADIKREDLPHLAAVAEERKVRHGELLFREGDDGDALYVIASGRVAVQVGGLEKPRTLALLGPGQVVGEMAILDGLPRSATARAEEDSVVVGIGRDEFRDLVNEHPGIAFAIFRVLSERLRTAAAAPHGGGPSTTGA